jgi:hypothetical protein
MGKYRTPVDVIAYKSKLRFLGICITKTLKWDAHVRPLSSKLSYVSCIMKLLKGIVIPYVISIYYTNFPPRLRYGI